MISNDLSKIYTSRFSELIKYRQEVWKVLCKKYFQQYVPESSVVLELGTGWGEFINNIKAAKKLAMDLNPETKQHLNENVSFFHQDCSDKWEISKSYLDVIFTSNFLEHLPDKEKIEKTIEQAYESLKSGGIIICLGPNIKFLPGTYWDFWDHYVPITESSIKEVLELKGFSIKLCLPKFLPYSMSRGIKPPLFFVNLYLKFPLAWKFFGKQFLVIASKPT
ncbi:MAG: methyltransferase domain-containing protein [Acidobacteria bacterium]|nr:methyltransferase domain-containing protein [Acidobacteriota bacterium]